MTTLNQRQEEKVKRKIDKLKQRKNNEVKYGKSKR